MDKEKETLRDIRRLKRLLKLIPEDRKVVGEKIFNELVFMNSVLDDLQNEIRTHGTIDNFKQGKQEFKRENPALKAYSTLVQRYSMLYKQLTDLLPKPETPDKSVEEIKTLLQRLEDRLEPHS